MKQDKNCREIFAASAHEQWSGWMQYLFSKGEFMDIDGTWVMPEQFVQQWMRQMNTSYEDLPESEKESRAALIFETTAGLKTNIKECIEAAIKTANPKPKG